MTASVRAESQLPDGRLNALLEQRTGLLNNRDSLRRELSSLNARVEELEQYKISLQRELVRLDRTDAASGILEDLKVTHCPACDQSVEAKSRSADSCFLCGQLTLDDEATAEAASRRLKFERDQVTAELAEAGELVQVALAEKRQKVATIGNVEKQLREIEHTLRPFQAKAAAVVPEELALIDQRIGTLHGRRQTIEALQGQLETGAQLTSEITQLQAEIKELESRVSRREGRVDFDEAGNRLSEGFNTYLDTIRGADDKSWTKTGAVSVSISERRTQLAIGGRPAKPQLGGTLTIYFVFAYHYALLNLSQYSDCHYPGVTILDFYPDIARENALGDRLHLVLSPFVQLSLDKKIEPIQVIATSRALPKRPHINYIHLTEPWR